MAKVSNLIALNLDPALMMQHEIMSKVTRIVDLKAIDGLRLMADSDSFKKASSLFSFISSSVTFIGGGDYHHLSLAILMKIKVPFTLIVFDNHTDLMDMNSGYISCGSWIRESFRLSKLKGVIIIGVNPGDEALKFVHPFSKPVRIIPFARHLNDRVIDAVLREIDTKDIYISIDKDVLNKKWAITNWNQGSMDLEELLDYLHVLINAKNLIGLDICGEWKIYDRLFMTEYDIKAVKKNEAVNIKILEAVS
ncbi:MAG: arginase family protein [Thermoanaerobacteraceae bacterium]|nr:arginase family protein [Thermoanaerobacteraceae bacterium]